MDNGMIPIREYVAANGNRCPRIVADVLLRQLPEAVARWRSEQLSPCGRLREEFIKVDAMSGYVEITAPCADEIADESDDVRDYGAIVSGLLATAMPRRNVNHRVERFVDACRRGDYATMGDVMLAVERRKSGAVYVVLVIVVVALVALLAWLNA